MMIQGCYMIALRVEKMKSACQYNRLLKNHNDVIVTDTKQMHDYH